MKLFESIGHMHLTGIEKTKELTEKKPVKKIDNEYCKNILTITAAESARAFECLPIIDNIDILRNIMYAGIWTKYNIIIQKRDKDPDREV